MYLNIPKRMEHNACKIHYNLFYARKNSTKDCPTLLLIPGGPGGDQTIYNDLIEALSEDVNLLLYDPRGCGKSGYNDVCDAGPDVAIDDIEFIRKYLNIDKLILLGGSYGSLVALKYTLKYPRNLYKLIVLSGIYSPKFIDVAKQKLIEIGTSEQIELGTKLLNGKLDNAAQLATYYACMMPLYIDGKNPVKPKNSEASKEKDKITKSDMAIKRALEILKEGFNKWLPENDLSDQLANIETKTLILTGDKDWIAPYTDSLEMHHMIKGSQLHIFSGAGHMIWKNPVFFLPFVQKIKNFVTDAAL